LFVENDYSNLDDRWWFSVMINKCRKDCARDPDTTRLLESVYFTLYTLIERPEYVIGNEDE
jgi:hypothetical protein